MTSVAWFRRDLRLHDHPALLAAIREGPVAPLFVLDPALLGQHAAARGRVEFMFRCLEALAAELEARGSALHVRHGSPARIVPEFASEVGAGRVHVSRDYGPYGRRRDGAVSQALQATGRLLVEHEGNLVHEPLVVDGAGLRPQRTFAAFRRRWLTATARPLLPAPGAFATAKAGPGDVPRSGEHARPVFRGPLPGAGEAAAQARLRAWVAGPIARYAEERDRLDLPGTSRVSQDLRWGLLSPLEVVAAAAGAPGSARFIDEIAWRDFSSYLLWHYPWATSRPLQARYATVDWPSDPGDLAAWSEGRTGYPVVDAAMRELMATGWMHNRARMIVASFLTKDLLVDWRLGQAHFLRWLVDGDVANNTAGWQWASSMGVDAQPYFRIFNPVAQGTRFDPSGDYVRRWIPELAAVPASHLHAPWTMSRALQESSGCVLGRDYPWPIVDHAEARQRALSFFRGQTVLAGPTGPA